MKKIMKFGELNENIIGQKDEMNITKTSVITVEYDEHFQSFLKIQTSNGQRYYAKLEDSRDIEDFDEYGEN